MITEKMIMPIMTRIATQISLKRFAKLAVSVLLIIRVLMSFAAMAEQSETDEFLIILDDYPVTVRACVRKRSRRGLLQSCPSI